MKKQILALAVSSLAAIPVTSMADTGPIVYGKVNVAYVNADDGTEDVFELQSNASRLGVKGDIDLDFDGVRAIYQAEFEMQVDDGDKGGQVFSQRNIFGGFTHDRFGTLKAGMFDSPVKKAQGKLDQLNDLQGDIKNLMAGDNRVENIVQYSTPRLGGVAQINVALIPGENDDGTGDDTDAADAVSSSVVVNMNSVYAALAYDREISDSLIADDTGLNTAGRIDILRAALMAKVAGFEVGTILQVAEEANGDGQDQTYFFSGAYSLDRWKFKGQYGRTDGDVSDNEVTLMGAAVDYKVASKSKLFAYYSDVESENGAGATLEEDTTYGVGFEHKFSM